MLVPLIDEVRRAAQGSHEAFAKLFEAYYAAVFAGALVRLGNPADAEDAAQETFIEAWRKLPRLREAEKFPGWLRRITIGRSGRISRRPKLLAEHSGSLNHLVSNESDPAAAAERNDAAAWASRALAKLPPAQREPIALVAGGFSYKDVAVLLNIPLGTVKRRIHDGRKSLSKHTSRQVSDALRRRSKDAQSKLRHALRIREEISRMKALLKAVSTATLDVVNEMYRACERITVADGKINGESVSPWVYAAVVERIRFNANLIGEALKPGAQSQVLLEVDGKRRDFGVEVGPHNEIVLALRA